VGIQTTPVALSEALTDTRGLSRWWTENTTGNGHEGQTIDFWFGAHRTSVSVVKVAAELVAWRVMEGHPAWIDTNIRFAIQEQGQQIIVDFSHDHWRESGAFFAHCSTKWAVFLLSLKALLETGKGRPFPHDVPINHN
jgi:hypothetical protein